MRLCFGGCCVYRNNAAAICISVARAAWTGWARALAPEGAVDPSDVGEIPDGTMVSRESGAEGTGW